jgi:hypothetical protein
MKLVISKKYGGSNFVPYILIDRLIFKDVKPDVAMPQRNDPSSLYGPQMMNSKPGLLAAG